MTIIWYTGPSGSGKTTAATKAIERDVIGVLLDGDEIREACTDFDFTRGGRQRHNKRVARLARVIHEQGFNVHVATICPYRDLRAECETLTGGHEWVYCDYDGPGHPEDVEYEQPEAAVV